MSRRLRIEGRWLISLSIAASVLLQLLPLPETPVTAVIQFNGMFTEMFFRLFKRAPVKLMVYLDLMRLVGISMCTRLLK